jgi:hypothetical protein
MAKVQLDLDFVVGTLPKSGAELAIAALNFNHQALQSMLDSGWPEAIRKTDHYSARRFLTTLSGSKDVDAAVGFFKKFMSGAQPDEVNHLLMQKELSDNQEVVIASWASWPVIDPQVFLGLLKASKELGADLEKEFSYSVYNENGGKLGKHTLMSMLVGQSDHHMTTMSTGIFSQDGKDEEPFHMNHVRSLIKAGAPFDKPTAAAMLQILKPAHTMKWMQFFKAEGAVTATEMVKMVSRLKPNPEVLAIMQAEAAAEAVDSVIKHPGSTP